MKDKVHVSLARLMTGVNQFSHNLADAVRHAAELDDSWYTGVQLDLDSAMKNLQTLQRDLIKTEMLVEQLKREQKENARKPNPNHG